MGLRTKWKPGDQFLVHHKDAALVVVEKRAGLLTHGNPGSDEENLFADLKAFLRDRPGERGLRVVHRLDRVVSGLLVFARQEKSYDRLVQQFAEHSVKRQYVACVKGLLEKDQGTISVPLNTKPMEVQVVEDEEDGRRAVTHYEVVQRFERSKTTMVKVRLETGLRNQIRVHFAHIGHPLLGERKYQPQKPSAQKHHRIFLHAEQLGFIHPYQKDLREFEARLPPDLIRWRNRLSKGCAEDQVDKLPARSNADIADTKKRKRRKTR